MVLRQPLYEQNDTTDQSADVVRLMLRDMMNERPGPVQANAMRVVQRSAGANNSVDISAGSIVVPGTSISNQGYYYVLNDATVNLPMSSAAHGSLPRIDTVIVTARDSFYSGANNDSTFIYVAGTAAASPAAPDITALGHLNFWRLANISVPANDNTITTAEITDLRTSSTIIPAQGAATAVGGIINCTSSSRPSTPREGQHIWETDTKRTLVNEGTTDTPNWQPVSHNTTWTSFTPSFTNVTIGSGGILAGKYIKLGRLAIAHFAFTLGTSGVSVGGRISWTPPAAISLLTGSGFKAASFAWANDSSGGGRWGAVGVQFSGETSLSRWGSDGEFDGWGTIRPFTWTINDTFQGFAIYETTT